MKHCYPLVLFLFILIHPKLCGQTSITVSGSASSTSIEAQTAPIVPTFFIILGSALVAYFTFYIAKPFFGNYSLLLPRISNYPNNTVKVFNRWDHLVFDVRSYKNDWQGFYKNNREKLPAGSYMYVIDLGDGSAPIQGWVYLNY